MYVLARIEINHSYLMKYPISGVTVQSVTYIHL